MEKLFLRGFFTYNELNIVDQKHIDRTVFVPESRHRRRITTTNGLDNFICKLFTGDVDDFFVRIFLQNRVADGVHQVCFAESGAAV